MGRLQPKDIQDFAYLGRIQEFGYYSLVVVQNLV